MQHQDRYKTILVIVSGLLVIAWVLQGNRPETAAIMVKVACVIGVVSVFIAAAARWIEWAWLKLALGLGWINSRILLSIVYFVFLLPVAWVSRLFTKDPLMLRKRNEASLYVTRNHQYKQEDLENIW